MKCLTCNKELPPNLDFYCSLGCAFKGVMNDADKLNKEAKVMGLIQQADDESDEEDQEFARTCDREKFLSLYSNQ